MNSDSKVRGIGILVFIGALILAVSCGVARRNLNNSQVRVVNARSAPIANLRELQTNANKLIKDLRKNEPTEDIVRRIEKELRAIEKTRIEAVRVAEKLKRHQKTLWKHQSNLSLAMKDYSENQMLQLQMLMNKMHQLQSILSQMMKVIQDTQKGIIEKMK